MRTLSRLSLASALLLIALALGACSSAGGTGELTSDESDVPAGMPVMYEFYTTS